MEIVMQALFAHQIRIVHNQPLLAIIQLENTVPEILMGLVVMTVKHVPKILGVVGRQMMQHTVIIAIIVEMGIVTVAKMLVPVHRIVKQYVNVHQACAATVAITDLLAQSAVILAGTVATAYARKRGMCTSARAAQRHAQQRTKGTTTQLSQMEKSALLGVR